MRLPLQERSLLVVILGADASKPCGMPDTADFTNGLREIRSGLGMSHLSGTFGTCPPT